MSSFTQGRVLSYSIGHSISFCNKLLVNYSVLEYVYAVGVCVCGRVCCLHLRLLAGPSGEEEPLVVDRAPAA